MRVGGEKMGFVLDDEALANHIIGRGDLDTLMDLLAERRSLRQALHAAHKAGRGLYDAVLGQHRSILRWPDRCGSVTVLAAASRENEEALSRYTDETGHPDGRYWRLRHD